MVLGLRRITLVSAMTVMLALNMPGARADVLVGTGYATWRDWVQTYHLTPESLVFSANTTDVLYGNPVVGHLASTPAQFSVGTQTAGSLVVTENAGPSISMQGGGAMSDVTIRQRPHITFSAISISVRTAAGVGGTEDVAVDVGTQGHRSMITASVTLPSGGAPIDVVALDGQAINSVTLSGVVPIQAIGRTRIDEGDMRSTAEADFAGEGTTDLLFWNPVTGGMAAWFMNGASAPDGGFVTQAQDLAWTPVGVGDFGGDGRPDILFQNASTGQLAVWFMNGLTPVSGALVTPAQDPQWRAVTVADFNGTGEADILFQNAATGQLAVWFMSGTTAARGAYVTPEQGPGWRCVGAGDLYGSGGLDLVFQNTATGQLALWIMEGTAAVAGAYINPVQDPAWVAQAIGDLAGDGVFDIVFRNTVTGQLALSRMNGASAASGAWITPSQNPGWLLVGKR